MSVEEYLTYKCPVNTSSAPVVLDSSVELCPPTYSWIKCLDKNTLVRLFFNNALTQGLPESLACSSNVISSDCVNNSDSNFWYVAVVAGSLIVVSVVAGGIVLSLGNCTAFKFGPALKEYGSAMSQRFRSMFWRVPTAVVAENKLLLPDEENGQEQLTKTVKNKRSVGCTIS